MYMMKKKKKKENCQISSTQHWVIILVYRILVAFSSQLLFIKLVATGLEPLP